MKTIYSDIPAYVTKDGSVIRELMHPASHGNSAQSLAEATVPPGGETMEHVHPMAEEIYHFTAGQGTMFLDGGSFEVRPGDTVHIAPGAAHRVGNPGGEPLVFLCCCSPPYSHEDTIMVRDQARDADRAGEKQP